MSSPNRPIVIATRGSALALAQAHLVFDQCRQAFPARHFEIKIVKTTGDRLQGASMAKPSKSLPKGLFTKELEVALLKGQADLAVHSLKDLPTELPAGLKLGAVGRRVDARDVLVYRDAAHVARGASVAGPPESAPGAAARRGCCPGTTLQTLPQGAVVATSSTRRQAQLQALRPDLRVVEIRGNVVTRLGKVAGQAELDATILAAAGLERLRFSIGSDGKLTGEAVPDGLLAAVMAPEEMLPAVGQAALGIEVRENDESIAPICEALNHSDTFHCVSAERAFLRAMGGGCQSPVAAFGEVFGETLRLRAVSFESDVCRRGEVTGPIPEAVALGESLAARLRSPG